MSERESLAGSLAEDAVALHRFGTAIAPQELERIAGRMIDAAALLRGEPRAGDEWMKAACERLEGMGFVVVGRNEWERVIPGFIERFPPHVQRAPREVPGAEPVAWLVVTEWLARRVYLDRDDADRAAIDAPGNSRVVPLYGRAGVSAPRPENGEQSEEGGDRQKLLAVKALGALVRVARVDAGRSLRECAADRGLTAEQFGRVERGVAAWHELAELLVGPTPALRDFIADSDDALRDLAALRPASALPSRQTDAPTHTDLMVSPESLDAYLGGTDADERIELTHEEVARAMEDVDMLEEATIYRRRTLHAGPERPEPGEPEKP